MEQRKLWYWEGCRDPSASKKKGHSFDSDWEGLLWDMRGEGERPRTGLSRVKSDPAWKSPPTSLASPPSVALVAFLAPLCSPHSRHMATLPLPQTSSVTACC